MSPLQTGFVLALVGVLGALTAFGVVVVRAALRSDGGPRPSARMAMRLLRAPEDRAELNRWAFYLHRLSGVAVFGFLCLHVVDVGIYALSPARFDEVHEVYGTAPMRVFECALLMAILFHTFNGLRLIVIDAADLGGRAAHRLLGGVVALTTLLTALAAAVILAPVLP